MSRDLRNYHVNKQCTCGDCHVLICQTGMMDHVKSNSHQITVAERSLRVQRERATNLKFEQKVLNEELIEAKTYIKELIQRLNDLKHPKYTPDNTETDNIAVLAETSDTI